MLGLRLDGDTEAKLARLARREGRTKSDLVRDALKAYLRQADDDAALIAEVRIHSVSALLSMEELKATTALPI